MARKPTVTLYKSLGSSDYAVIDEEDYRTIDSFRSQGYRSESELQQDAALRAAEAAKPVRSIKAEAKAAEAPKAEA